MNVKKTTYLIFKPWQKKCNHNFSISLTQTNTTKFLGLYIDEHLTWKDHISCLCKQMSKSIEILFRSRFCLSSKTKLTLYYSLIYPHITYCNTIWSSTYVTNLNRIYCLQKRAVRAITNSDYSAPLFSKLRILDIFQINTFQTAKFMYRYHNNLLPSLFLNLFNTSIVKFIAIAPEQPTIIECITAELISKKFTILYQGPKTWNSLPVTITSTFSFPNFKKKLLDFLVK